MQQTFQIGEKDARADTLLLIYPPAAIRELAESLDRIERLFGSLPAVMQVPVYGTFVRAITPSASCASAESALLSV
jgi:hypothetical protein